VLWVTALNDSPVVYIKKKKMMMMTMMMMMMNVLVFVLLTGQSPSGKFSGIFMTNLKVPS